MKTFVPNVSPILFVFRKKGSGFDDRENKKKVLELRDFLRLLTIVKKKQKSRIIETFLKNSKKFSSLTKEKIEKFCANYFSSSFCLKKVLIQLNLDINNLNFWYLFSFS